jgi:hypothetical protein
MPISRLSITSCVGLELRPLPSTGVTRLQRYYGPLRNPRRPSLSLAGVWLRGSAPRRLGFPCCVDLRVPTCRRHYPGGPLGSDRSRVGLFQPPHSSPTAAAFPVTLPGRRPHWPFRGLLDVHSGYGLSARCIAKAIHLSRRLRWFRPLHHRSDSYRLERPSCRVGIAPTENQHLSTAHNVDGPFVLLRNRFAAIHHFGLRIVVGGLWGEWHSKCSGSGARRCDSWFVGER